MSTVPEPLTIDRRVLGALRGVAAEHPVACRVRGDCMAPLLVAGARVLVRRRRAYWPGDVLAFRSTGGRLLVHRLIGYRLRAGRWCFVTQADAAGRVDRPVARSEVLGRVCGGEVEARAVRIPVTDRLIAGGRFVRAALLRLRVALS